MNTFIKVYDYKLYFFLPFILLSYLPPFYLIVSEYPYLYSHNIARFFIILLFLILLIDILFRKKHYHINPVLIFLILLYFISQSTSVLTAINMKAFLGRYQNIIFGLIIYFTFIYFIKSKKEFLFILNILNIAVLLHLILQYIIYFHPSIFFELFKGFFLKGYWDSFLLEFKRSKYFLDIYDGSMIPFIYFQFYTSQKLYKKISFLAMICGIVFFSFLSNFRIIFIMSIFSFLFSFFLIKKRKNKYAFLLMGLVVITLISAYFISTQKIGMSVLNRFIGSPEKINFFNKEDIISREYLWNEAFKMGSSSLLFGIGLGNFYDHLPFSKSPNLSLFEWRNQLFERASAHPHNIFFTTFAESGLFGLIAFMILLGFFLQEDISNFKKNKKNKELLFCSIIGFWNLMIFALFHQANYLPFLSMFWIMRSLSAISLKRIKD